jgi:hypothetical protein
MFLFKASGQTYLRVVKRELHAFPNAPRDIEVGQLVLLSKNREDCTPSEPQIQHVAKVLQVRSATPEELEHNFPGVEASNRFRIMVELYWREPLERPFSLSQVPGVNYKRYDTVQDFAKLDEADEMAVFGFLVKTNRRLVLSYLNRDDLPAKLRSQFDDDADQTAIH